MGPLRSSPYANVIAACVVVAAFPATMATIAASPQTPGLQTDRTVPVVAYLGGNRSVLEWVLAGMRDSGYVAERDFHLEARLTEGSLEKQSRFAAELVALRPNVIVATGTAVIDLKKLTSALPIVVTVTNRAAASQVMDSLEHPGGNVTGVVSEESVRDQRRLLLLYEAVPGLKRIAVLAPDRAGVKPAVQAAAAKLGVQLDIVAFTNAGQLEEAFDKLAATAPRALFVGGGSLTLANMSRIASLAAARKWPSIAENRELPDRGGLMSYGGFGDARRVAWYVDRILKGAKPADLPAELQQQWQLVINMKSAMQLGLTIPQSILAQTVEIIR